MAKEGKFGYFVVDAETSNNWIYYLKSGTTSIGSDVNAAVRLEENTNINPNHCFVLVNSDGFAMLQPDSHLYSTKLNGQEQLRKGKNILLKPNDFFEVGNVKIIYKNDFLSEQVLQERSKKNLYSKLFYTPRRSITKAKINLSAKKPVTPVLNELKLPLKRRGSATPSFTTNAGNKSTIKSATPTTSMLRSPIHRKILATSLKKVISTKSPKKNRRLSRESSKGIHQITKYSDFILHGELKKLNKAHSLSDLTAENKTDKPLTHRSLMYSTPKQGKQIFAASASAIKGDNSAIVIDLQSKKKKSLKDALIIDQIKNNLKDFQPEIASTPGIQSKNKSLLEISSVHRHRKSGIKMTPSQSINSVNAMFNTSDQTTPISVLSELRTRHLLSTSKVERRSSRRCPSISSVPLKITEDKNTKVKQTLTPASIKSAQKKSSKKKSDFSLKLINFDCSQPDSSFVQSAHSSVTSLNSNDYAVRHLLSTSKVETRSSRRCPSNSSVPLKMTEDKNTKVKQTLTPASIKSVQNQTSKKKSDFSLKLLNFDSSQADSSFVQSVHSSVTSLNSDDYEVSLSTTNKNIKHKIPITSTKKSHINEEMVTSSFSSIATRSSVSKSRNQSLKKFQPDNANNKSKTIQSVEVSSTIETSNSSSILETTDSSSFEYLLSNESLMVSEPKNINVSGITLLGETPNKQALNKRLNKSDTSNNVADKSILTVENAEQLSEVLESTFVTNVPSRASKRQSRTGIKKINDVKELFKTSKLETSPKNDLTDVRGVRKLLKTPRAIDSPKNDLTDVQGMKELFRTPIPVMSPKNDLTHVQSAKKLLKTPKSVKSPKNDLSDLQGVNKLLKTPKPAKFPENDLTHVQNVKKLSKTPKPVESPKNDLSDQRGSNKLLKTPKPSKSPKNDLTHVQGVKKLLKTPKAVKSPKNDLTDVRGVKKILKTPKPVKSPKNDLTNVEGVRKLLKTPKAVKSPKNDLTDVKGVKKLLRTPRPIKSPKNDLTNVYGVKKLLKTPRLAKSPKNDLTDVQGVKKLLSTPKIQKTPKNDLSNIPEIKGLFVESIAAKSPKNDLTDVRGVKRLLKTPKLRASPKNDLINIPSFKHLYKEPEVIKSPKNDLTNIKGIKRLLKTPGKSPNNDLSNISGIENLFKEEKRDRSPKNDVTNVKSPRRTLHSPKLQNSPRNDLADIKGIKQIFRTPKNQTSKNDLANTPTIKKLYDKTTKSSAKKRKSDYDIQSKEELSEISVIKQNNFETILSSIEVQKTDSARKKVLSERKINEKSSKCDYSNVVGVKRMFAEEEAAYRSNLNVSGIASLFDDSIDVTDKFAVVFDKKPLRTYSSKSPHKKTPVNQPASIENSPAISTDVINWVNTINELQYDKTQVSAVTQLPSTSNLLRASPISPFIRSLRLKKTSEAVTDETEQHSKKRRLRDNGKKRNIIESTKENETPDASDILSEKIRKKVTFINEIETERRSQRTPRKPAKFNEYLSELSSNDEGRKTRGRKRQLNIKLDEEPNDKKAKNIINRANSDDNGIVPEEENKQEKIDKKKVIKTRGQNAHKKVLLEKEITATELAENGRVTRKTAKSNVDNGTITKENSLESHNKNVKSQRLKNNLKSAEVQLLEIETSDVIKDDLKTLRSHRLKTTSKAVLEKDASEIEEGIRTRGRPRKNTKQTKIKEYENFSDTNEKIDSGVTAEFVIKNEGEKTTKRTNRTTRQKQPKSENVENVNIDEKSNRKRSARTRNDHETAVENVTHETEENVVKSKRGRKGVKATKTLNDSIEKNFKNLNRIPLEQSDKPFEASNRTDTEVESTTKSNNVKSRGKSRRNLEKTDQNKKLQISSDEVQQNTRSRRGKAASPQAQTEIKNRNESRERPTRNKRKAAKTENTSEIEIVSSIPKKKALLSPKPIRKSARTRK